MTTVSRAAAMMRGQHGPKHERHEMWKAMADLIEALDSGANDQEAHDLALAVARAYIGAVS